MPIGNVKLFDHKNMPSFISGLGQSPFPMRGLERFMLKRGIYFPRIPQGETQHFPKLREENLSNTLDVQEPPQQVGGIKGFLSKFSRKSK